MENKCQITKTIRFKAEPKSINLIKEKIKYIEENSDFILATFILELKEFIDNSTSYLFKEFKEESKIKDYIIVKSEWLRLYAKQEYFNYQESQKGKYTYKKVPIVIKDIKGLSSIIETLFNNINQIYQDLATDARTELNERAKRAKTALLINKLSIKSIFPCLDRKSVV